MCIAPRYTAYLLCFKDSPFPSLVLCHLIHCSLLLDGAHGEEKASPQLPQHAGLVVGRAAPVAVERMAATATATDSSCNSGGGGGTFSGTSRPLPGGQPTYPRPKNFPQRLMLVMESEAASNAIWWEEDGQTVALRVHHLKNGPVLGQHFQGIRYKFFIRYFSRW